MNTQIIPIVRATGVAKRSKTVFNTLNHEITVEAPGVVITTILNLCDGSRNLESIIEELSQKWDRVSIEGLLKQLLLEGVIVDGRDLQTDFAEITKNPMRFPKMVTDEQVAELVKGATKRHRSEKPDNWYFPSTNSYSELISHRKSVRSFTGETIEFQLLIDLLWSAYGECLTKSGYPHRTVPSAGALYPLVIHVGLMQETSDLDSGVYRVLYGEDGKVGFKKTSSDALKFARAFLNPIEIENGVHGVIVISGSYTVSNDKYGNRSLLYVPIEAGHVAQNILLTATQQGIATLEIGGFVSDLLADATILPEDYHPLITVAFGKEKVSTDKQFSSIETDWGIPMAGGYCPSFAMASARLPASTSWSHGRDPSPELAMKKAISETKEWTSCGNIPELTYATYDELRNAVDPREIIRFHECQYRQKNFPFVRFNRSVRYGWTSGYDLRGNEFKILADHVYFPYFPETPYYCYSNSSGCAAHPDRQTAIEIGTLELVERDSFINAYFAGLDRPIVSLDTLPDVIRKRILDLNEANFEVWVVDHSLDLAPVVFVMAQNKELHFTTCASCSSFDVEYAVSHALMEVEASVMHRLQSGAPEKLKPTDVIWPNDHGKLYGQKEYFQRANFMVSGTKVVSFHKIGSESVTSWSQLMDCFQEKGWAHIVVPLELSDKFGGNGDLSIVRVLVPGTTQMTFGYRQEPAGMSRLYDVARKFGKGNLAYGQLTKFPHPFE